MNKRQAIILQIIKNHRVSTQEELAQRLQQEGINVTQATVSRDIKKLGLVKVPGNDTNYYYSLPQHQNRGEVLNWLKKMVQDFVLGIDYGGNLVVVKTLPGTAQALASGLDGANWEEVMGSVAGDDTIFLAVREEKLTVKIYQRIHKLMD